MKNRIPVRIVLAVLFLSGVLYKPSTVCAQGSLTPPGAPAPTMKSLDEIYSKLEARTPVSANTTPGDANNSFIIGQPGSYYLTSNIVGVTGKDGIKIATNNVTLDLNGFSLLGAGIANNGGIYIFNNCQAITIRNGMICGWTNSGVGGIYCNGRNVTFEQLTVSNNYSGIYCVSGAMVRDCFIIGNFSHGVDVNGSGSFILENDFVGNNSGNSSGSGSIVAFGPNNRIEGNHVTGSGVPGYGIYIANIFNITNNIVIRNSVEGGGTNNYFFNANQVVGPLITNTVSGIITNSNPWANFSF